MRVTSTSQYHATHTDIWQTSIIATSYIVIYPGLGQWIMWKISRFGEVRLVTRVLVNVLVLMVGVFVPWTIQLTDRDLRDAGYTLLQLSNPIWTLWECWNKGVPIVGPVLTAGLPAFAILGGWQPVEPDGRVSSKSASPSRHGSPKKTPNWRSKPPAARPAPVPGIERFAPGGCHSRIL